MGEFFFGELSLTRMIDVDVVSVSVGFATESHLM